MRKAASYIFLLLSFSPFVLRAQAPICEGNLGENIFEEGDFGTGSSNVLTVDPGIAPGYSYDTSVPPNDGEYVLTKNTAAWGGNYGTWLNIPDNSSDPDGYMMVVNADYTPGLFYDQPVEGLCENTVYEFSADVINMIMRNVTDHIKPNVSFLIDGQEVFNTGEIPQDERWHTYGFTFSTEPGQTQVQLSLRNNAPGGIGNDLALDNISFRPCGPEALILPDEVENICEDGDPIDLDATINGSEYDTPAFQWQQSFDEGATWSDIPGSSDSVYTHDELSSGYYYYRYLLANGPGNLQNSKCRVISNPKIVYVVPKFWDVVDTLCQGLSYEQNGNVYTTSGTYVDTLISSIGCDSIVTLQLNIRPDPGMTADVAVQDMNCHDSNDGSVMVENVANGTPPLRYHLTGQPESASGTFGGLPDGNYDLEITDRYGCEYQENITIQQPAKFTVDLGPDLDIKLGDRAPLRPLANYAISNYQWNPPEAIDCNDDCSTLIWYPTKSLTLALQATSDRGCVANDTLEIFVRKDRRLFLPNAFSPNGDGINDVFTVFGQMPNVQEVKQFVVFDRWGNLLFEQANFAPNDQASGWDGTFQGEELENGVYVYFVEVLFLDGEERVVSGDVLLLR